MFNNLGHLEQHLQIFVFDCSIGGHVKRCVSVVLSLTILNANYLQALPLSPCELEIPGRISFFRETPLGSSSTTTPCGHCIFIRLYVPPCGLGSLGWIEVHVALFRHFELGTLRRTNSVRRARGESTVLVGFRVL